MALDVALFVAVLHLDVVVQHVVKQSDKEPNTDVEHYNHFAILWVALPSPLNFFAFVL